VFVASAQAGVQELNTMLSFTAWIPAFAGTTDFDVSVSFSATR
jgi:hypothetical protein